MTEDLLQRVAASHKDEYPALDSEFLRKAITRFIEIRSRKLEKPPASGELLAWLQVLSLTLGNDSNVLNADLQQLPYLSTLIKSPDTPSDLSRHL